MEYNMPLIYELQSYEDNLSRDNIYKSPLKAKNLDLYLSQIKKKHPKAVLLGGHPFFTGSRKTGIPFTDEYIIGSEKIKFLEDTDVPQKYSIQNKKYRKDHILDKDYGSNVIWDHFGDKLDTLLLWDIYPFYPHKEYAYSSVRPLTNQEKEDGFQFFQKLLIEFESIDTILIASDVAAEVIEQHGGFDQKYRLYHVSNPAISGTEEFIARVAKALEYKEELLEAGQPPKNNDEISYRYRERWADTDASGHYYCRALHDILSEEDAYYCKYCPCNLKQPLYCGYYDFNRTDLGNDLNQIKMRFQMLMDAHLIPVFPDYMKRSFSSRGFIVEKAFQFAAKRYRTNRKYKNNMPYIMFLARQLTIIYPYIMSMESQLREDIMAGVILQTILYDTDTTSFAVENRFGDYVLSLISYEHEDHTKNVAELLDYFDEMGIPDYVMDVIIETTRMQGYFDN